MPGDHLKDLNRLFESVKDVPFSTVNFSPLVEWGNILFSVRLEQFREKPYKRKLDEIRHGLLRISLLLEEKGDKKLKDFSNFLTYMDELQAELGTDPPVKFARTYRQEIRDLGITLKRIGKLHER